MLVEMIYFLNFYKRKFFISIKTMIPGDELDSEKILEVVNHCVE